MILINFPSKQRGIALITVLLIVAIATIIAVSLAHRQQIDIRRTANLINQQQAYYYVLGAESWAKLILMRDGEKSQTIDHLGEVWATQLPPTLIEGGILQASIEDLQGKFNLNNLLTTEGKPDTQQINYFKQLLKEIADTNHDSRFSEREIEQLVEACIDWIDDNDSPTLPYGAEDNRYLLKKPAYRTANRPFSSLSELHLLEGMNNELFQTLQAYITVLPTHTAININTAPALVLKALSEQLRLADIELLIKKRQSEPFNNLQEFMRSDAFAGIVLESKNLDVASHYFLLTGYVMLDNTQITLQSLFYRQQQNVLLIQRAPQI